MHYLIRMFNRENWPDSDEARCDFFDLGADILNDFQPTNNKLSMWHANNSDDIENAIFAFLTASVGWARDIKEKSDQTIDSDIYSDKRIERSYFLVIKAKDIKAARLQYEFEVLEDEKYRSPFDDLNAKHVELITPKVGTIKTFSDMILSMIENDEIKMLSAIDIAYLFAKKCNERDVDISGKIFDNKSPVKWFYKNYVKELLQEMRQDQQHVNP